MRKLPAVETARAIMWEGTEWGVWKWMLEKKRVRETADRARTALDDFEMKIKDSWSNDLKIAYNHLVSQDGDVKQGPQRAKPVEKKAAPKNDSQLITAVKRVKAADDEAFNAHEEAEDLFAEAEKHMSTSMAREGARKALEAYDLHEAAIRKAEALAPTK